MTDTSFMTPSTFRYPDERIFHMCVQYQILIEDQLICHGTLSSVDEQVVLDPH